MQSDYEIHPAANIFPMMTAEEYDGLKADILANGQREWAVLCDGKLLDGRNRMRACKELSVELECCELEAGTDPISYVLSKNLHRRHLSQSQRAQCAAEVAKLRHGGDRKSEDIKGQDCPSISAAAHVFNVSKRSVKSAKHVADKGDKATVEAVKAGEITVSAAAQLVDAVPDKKEQRRIVKEGPKAVAAKIKEWKPTKEADGGAEPNTTPLADSSPDPVGVVCRPPDRVTFLLDGLGTLWREYQQMFRSEAEWLPWRVAVEQFSVLMDKD